MLARGCIFQQLANCAKCTTDLNFASGRALAFDMTCGSLRCNCFHFHFPWDNLFSKTCNTIKFFRIFLKNKDIQDKADAVLA